jgi:hypothetical protein
VLSEALSGTALPDTMEVGRIGAGGEGEFLLRLVHRSGSSDPSVIVHGRYIDAAGTEWEFCEEQSLLLLSPGNPREGSYPLDLKARPRAEVSLDPLTLSADVSLTLAPYSTTATRRGA